MGSVASTVTKRLSVRRTVMLSDPFRRPSRAPPMIRSDSASTEASPRPSTSAIPTLPCTKAVATRKGWANCASTTWVGRRFAGPRPNCSVCPAGSASIVTASMSSGRSMLSRARAASAASIAACSGRPQGVGLVAQCLAAETRAQVAQEHRCVVSIGLVQLEEAETAIKDVPRAGEPGLRQQGRENAGACRLARLQPLGQRPVQDALAIAGGVTVGDAKRGQHLFPRQADQLACGRGGAEHPDRSGAMPAPVERARKRDAARYVETQGDRQQDITPTDTPTGTPEAIAYCEDRPQHGNPGMDGTPGVKSVVEIKRMTH